MEALGVRAAYGRDQKATPSRLRGGIRRRECRGGLHRAKFELDQSEFWASLWCALRESALVRGTEGSRIQNGCSSSSVNCAGGTVSRWAISMRPLAMALVSRDVVSPLLTKCRRSFARVTTM